MRSTPLSNGYNHWRSDWVGRPWLAIRDTPGWQEKWALGPVHFDVLCLKHEREFLEVSPQKLPSTPEEFQSFLKCCYP